VRFTANALGFPHEYIKVNLREGEHRKPEFLKLNPVGKIPVIDDDGFVLFESNAIIKYLADKNNSPLYPKGLKERATIDKWIEFSSHHVGLATSKVVYNRFFAPRIGTPVDETSLKEGLAWIERFYPVIDQQIGANQYLVFNQFSLADVNLLAILDPAEIANIDLSKFHNITRWRENLKKQDFYTKCHKEFAEMLKQPAGR
jgi:glutathione S-transferase